MGGRALKSRGWHLAIPTDIKLRMPTEETPAVRLRVIRSVVKRETAQINRSGPRIYAKWKRKWRGVNS